MEKDYNEILLQAMDTVIAQRLSELKFDKTIICTITDDSERANGLYKVTDGSVVFEAYSDNSYYSKDNQVYVNIPSGDLTQKKQITGRYTTDLVNDPIIYVRPLEKVANLAQITDLNKNLSASIEANGPKNEIKISEFTDSYDTAIYDTLAIQADFQCLLDAYSMRCGRYGLRVHFAQVENGKEISGGDLFLDSMTDMFGNPYAYIAPMMQQQAHKFSSPIGIINTISIYLYQNGDFKYKEEDKKEPTPIAPNGVPNIWVSNINVFLGTDVSQVADKTVKIYTNDNMNYSPDNLSRSIRLIWYNKTQDNKLLGFDDGEFHKNYAMGNSKIPEGDSNIYYWIEWYADDSSGAAKLINEGEIISQEISCIPQITMTEVYAIIWRNGQKYKSNYLTFTNQTAKSNLVFGEDIILSIINDKNAQDAYPIYGEDNLAMPGEANKTRTIRVKPIWRLGSLENYDWTGTTIEWKVPEGASMIVAEPQTKIVDKTITFEEAVTFSYRLSEVYHELYFNNVITCTITLPSGFAISTSKNIVFSSQGNSGTDYTLVVKPTDDRIYGFKDGADAAAVNEFTAALLDLEGNQIADGSCIQWLTNDGFASDKYNVIKATAGAKWAGRSITLETLYPIIYSLKNEYHASVPIKIIYDSFGSLTKAMKSGVPLELFKGNEKIEPKWEIIYSFTKPETEDNESNKKEWDIYKRKLSQMPQVNYEKDNKIYTLVAPSIYTGLNAYAYLKATYNNEIVWTSPLIIQQYKYGSSVLNNWDGETIIDNENNRILTNAFAAGYMDNKNTFNGVILGEVENIDGESKKSHTGLYGYKNGAQTYGFRDDGTAFIGGSGAGRIQFNGTEGIIASNGWIKPDGSIKDDSATDATGLKIDLKNGTLFSKQFSIDASGDATFKGNITGASGTFEGDLKAGDFSVTKDGGVNFKNIFKVETNGTIIFGNPDDEKNRLVYSGGTLDIPDLKVSTISADKITSGKLGGTNKGITVGGWEITDTSLTADGIGLFSVYPKTENNGVINGFSSSNWRIVASNTFGVTSDGQLHAASGKIAGWTIASNGLYNGDSIDSTDIALLPQAGQWYRVCGRAGTDWVITAGAWREDGRNFGITNQGHLYAREANITGTITAHTGQIGDWHIKNGIFGNSDSSLVLSPQGVKFLMSQGAYTTLTWNQLLETSRTVLCLEGVEVKYHANTQELLGYFAKALYLQNESGLDLYKISMKNGNIDIQRISRV